MSQEYPYKVSRSFDSMTPAQVCQDPNLSQPDLEPADHEGRFYGGGITALEEDILYYLDKQERLASGGTIIASDDISLRWLNQHAHVLHKRIAKNSELRAKFADRPLKYIESEEDLDADIRDFSILSDHPELYSAFVQLGCVTDFVGLLTHDNADIAVRAIEILAELSDDDTVSENDGWHSLVTAMVNADIVEVILANLLRLDEENESERTGIYHALGVLEHICSHTAGCATVTQNKQLIRWLLDRANRLEYPVSQNTQYSAEILAVVAQLSSDSCGILIELNATDKLLQLVDTCRKQGPLQSSGEREYMKNLFGILTSIVTYPSGKASFIESVSYTHLTLPTICSV